MDILLVLLRLLHIIAAFVWIALGLTQVLFVGPAVGKSGESGLRFLKALLTKTAFPMAFPIAAGLTVLAGILLYFVSNSASHFSTTGNIVLGIGAASGLLAAGHGGAVVGSRDVFGSSLGRRRGYGAWFPWTASAFAVLAPWRVAKSAAAPVKRSIIDPLR